METPLTRLTARTWTGHDAPGDLRAACVAALDAFVAGDWADALRLMWLISSIGEARPDLCTLAYDSSLELASLYWELSA